MNRFIDSVIKDSKLDSKTILEDNLSNLYLKIICDIGAYLDFIQSSILPSISIFEQNYNDSIQNEIHKEFLSHTKIVDKQESAFIGLFYVGIFHKIENFENEIIECFNRETDSKVIKIQELGIDQNDNFFYMRNKFRLISNSIKHNNSYPKKELEKCFPNFNAENKIELTKLDLQDDIKQLRGYLCRVFAIVHLKAAKQHVSKLLKLTEEKDHGEIKAVIAEMDDTEEYIKKIIKTSHNSG